MTYRTYDWSLRPLSVEKMIRPGPPWSRLWISHQSNCWHRHQVSAGRTLGFRGTKPEAAWRVLPLWPIDPEVTLPKQRSRQFFAAPSNAIKVKTSCQNNHNIFFSTLLITRGPQKPRRERISVLHVQRESVCCFSLRLVRIVTWLCTWQYGQGQDQGRDPFVEEHEAVHSHTSE